MNAVIYARYSSHNQTECSIEGQLEECRKYARQNNINIIGEYIDRAKSGTKDDRDNFLKMIEDSKNKTFEGVLVYQLDRFARNKYDSVIYKKQLKDRGIRVLSARENISQDASGILMESVLEGMAEYFSVELGQKVRRGMKLNADCCYYNGGTIPLGYKLEEVNDDRFNNGIKKAVKKKYVIDEEKAPIVKKIFEMYANDNKMIEIINYLNSLDLKTAYNKPFNKSSIRRILENKKYIGIYSYHGKETKDAIPRIVDDDLFYKVQQELRKNSLAPARRRAKTEYLLSGKLYCGLCKEKMTGSSGTSKTGKLHTYYSCKSASKHLCDMDSIKKDDIEDIVSKACQDILTKDNINLVAKKIVEYANNEKNTIEYKQLSKALKENERRKNNIVKAITECEDNNTRQILFDELSKIQNKLDDINQSLLIEKAKHLNLGITEVKYFLNNLKKGNINKFKYKKILINTLVNKVYLYKDKAIILFNINNHIEEVNISLLNDIESSLLNAVALPLENDTNFYSSFFIFLVLSPFLFFIYEYYIKRGMIE